MTESTISKRLGLTVSHYDSKLFSLCMLHVIEPFKSWTVASMPSELDQCSGVAAEIASL